MEFLQNIINRRLILTAIVIIVSIIVYIVIQKIVSHALENVTKNKSEHKKSKTYLKLVKNILNYVLLFIDLILILQIYGVNVSSLVAGLGIVSIITGLALQDAFKDIIGGFNIITDGYYNVGDVVKIGDVEGKVTEVNLRVTKLKDINNENILVLANRNIVQALLLSNMLDIDIPLPYEENTEKIENIISEIVSIIKENKKIEKVEYKGINEFGDSALYYKIRMWCSPENKPQVKRDCNRIIKQKLDENGITIPYTQIDIHQK